MGQNNFEEIDIIKNSGNYGWVTREGFHCFDPFDPTNPPAVCSNTGPNAEPLLDPVAEYNHGDGIAVIGGFVYRGSAIAQLVGQYVFGDFSTSFGVPDGRLFYLDADGNLSDIFEFLTDTPLSEYLLGFGQDEDGELYVLTSTSLGPTGSTGQVFRIVPEPATLALLALGF